MNTIKESIIKNLEKLTRFLQNRWYESKTVNTSPINSLSPKILTEKEDLKRIQPYLKNLKAAIDSEGVNNIAITGSYGSGKSTILKTFQHLNRGYEYLNISLASFKENERKPDDTEFERRLEVSILQQMFYRVKPSEIPDSRFKRIINLTSKKLFSTSLFLILWSFSSLILFKFDGIEKLNPEGWKLNNPLEWTTLLSSLIFFIGIGLFVKNIYRLFKNSKINKLSIKGELELGESIDKSVFNQHLEEVLYFFERTTFNVVVIEDVDRFDSTDIFTKLREINILVNNSDLIKRPIKFIYAVKDEMFKDKNERVKFFEFIIPVIPFINPSNANDQLTKLITHAQLQNVLSADFTSDVVTFIDDIDMRLLINIFHEYQLYSTILSKDLVQDKLLSIIIYKNLFPADFGKLQKRKGRLYRFFNAKSIYISEITEQYEAQIEETEMQIELLENEVGRPIKELRAVYIHKIVSKLDKFHAFHVDDEDVTISEALEDNHFKNIKTSNKIGYTFYEGKRSSYGGYDVFPSAPTNANFDFDEIEKEISSKSPYNQREKILYNKINNRINILKIEKEKLKQEINRIESMSIRKLFELVDTEEYLGFFKNNNLMRNLLLNGYIDEHYDDYISLFHGINLTKEDFTFERKVKSGHSLPFDYSITKFENLIKRLPEHYFQKEEILNYSLLSFLLENTEKYMRNIDYWFKYLRIDGEKQFGFIDGYIKTNPKKIDIFIKALVEYKPNLCRYIFKKSMLPDEEIKNLLRTIFNYAGIDDILKFEKRDYLETYLFQMNDFFLFCSTLNQTDTIESFITDRVVLFESLDVPTEHQQQLFEAIYEKNLYLLNQHNIRSIIMGDGKMIYEKELNSSHYTNLLSLDMKNLLSYIDGDIEQYIEEAMLLIEDNTEEDEQTIVDILNRDDVDLDLKERVVRSQNATITSIMSVKSIEAKQIVFQNNKLVPNWTNIFDYYDKIENIEFDETLINFLNEEKNHLILSKNKLNVKNKDEKVIKEVSLILIKCNELHFNAYTCLVDSIPYQYKNLNLDELDIDKIEVLIVKYILSLTSDNFDGLKSKGNELHIKLIEVYQDLFIEKLDELELETDDYLKIFKSTTISIPNKLNFVQQIVDSVIINNKSIAYEIGSILPDNRPFSFSFEVLVALFDTRIPISKKITLLNLHFDRLSNIEIQELIEKLGYDYKRIFLKKNKPDFPIDPQHTTLFSNLQKKDLIIRYEVKDAKNKIKVFAKY